MLIASALIVLLAAGLVVADWQGEAILGRPPLQPPGPPPAQPSATGLDPQAYLPITIGQPASSQPWVNTQNKNEVRNFYLTEYPASEGVPSGWNSNHGNCNAGNTSAAFKTAVLRRINFFRSMAGLPPVTAFKNDYNTNQRHRL